MGAMGLQRREEGWWKDPLSTIPPPSFAPVLAVFCVFVQSLLVIV